LNLWDGRYSIVVFFIISICLLFFSFVRPGAFEQTRLRTAEVFAPAIGTISQPFQQAASIAEDIAGISHMRTEMAMLRQENARLREWYRTALMLEAENKSLQELLNIKTDPRHSFVTARVISDSGNAYVHSMLVAAGLSSGVDKGQAALAVDGLIGRIIEAGDNVSRILLLTDFNSRIPVIIQGSRQKAVLVGNNSDQPSLEYLPPDANISNGSRVVTSGDGGVFPPGLPIGIVALEAGGVYKVKVFADLEKIIYVRIVDRPDSHSLAGGALSPAR
jgi:rod shape-determining protein MreC